MLRYGVPGNRKNLLAGLAGVAMIGVVCFLFSRRSNRAPSTPESGSGYVDAAACSVCHQDIAKTYRLTGMGRSVYRPRPENRVEDYSARNHFHHRTSDRYYTLIERGGRFYQRRHQIGFDGKETNIVEKAVDYVIGSGNHARTYLHRTSEGKLVELPVSWYAEKGGYWDMSPGYDREDQQDFRRAIPYQCMFCHNGYPAPDQVLDVTGDETVFGDRIPEGIDCQRCHGPGRAHIAAASSGRATLDSIRRAIIHPTRLGRDRQLEICMQCHLETTSRQLPNAIPHYGRAPFSYRPGEPLADAFLYFDHASGTGRDDKFEIAHAAYRLRKSACFRASQMTCTTCHNPHQVPRGKEAIGHYIAVCRNCHQSAHSSGTPGNTDCLGCHMPKRRADDAVHVVMTDHYIQRLGPPRDMMAPLQEINEGKNTYRGEVTLYYPLQLPHAPENDLYLGVAQVQHGANLHSGIPRLKEAVEKYAPLRPEFYFELGKAYSKAGKDDEAIHWYDEALRRAGDFRPALKGLAISLSVTGRLTRAAEVLEKGVTAPFPDAALLTNLGNVYLQQGKVERAGEVLQRAIGVNPDVPEAHNLLGLVCLRKEDRALAERRFRDAISIQPDFAEAHNNLANLLAGTRDYAQAGYHFEKAIAINRAYVQAHHSYGLFLVLIGSYDRALVELQEAVRLDPKLAQAHTDLADVLAAKGRIESATGEYGLAIQLSPELAEPHYGLGNALAAQGKSVEAEKQFRLAIQSKSNYHEAHLALASILARKGNVAEARTHYESAAESLDPVVRQAALKALR